MEFNCSFYNSGCVSPSLRLMAGFLALLLLAPAAPAEGGFRCGPGLKGPSRRLGPLPAGIGEVSGVAASRAYPRVAWAIRDSGHPAHLYALVIDKGQIRARVITVPNASNRDWEDLSYTIGKDGRGHLWVVESGQSGGQRFIYEILEPDPYRDDKAKLLGRYEYAYPDGRHANTEASFVHEGRLVLVTKTVPPRLYRFDRPLSRDSVNRPVYEGKLRRGGLVSVARLSPGNHLFVTATHEVVRVYQRGEVLNGVADLTQAGTVAVRRVAPGDNVEAGDFFPFGQCRLLLVSERRNTYRLKHI